MSTDIIVRQATVADWPAIKAFLFDAYGDLASYKDWPRWEWQFCQNPYLAGAATNDVVPVWIAVDNQRVVGQIAVQAGQLELNGVQESAGWIVDVMVLPEYRGRQLGHKIHAKCAESENLLVTLTMAPATRRIAEKAGCINLKAVRQFTRLVRPDKNDVFNYIMSRTLTRPRFHQAARVLTKYGSAHTLVAWIVRLYASFLNRKGLPFAKVAEIDVREAQNFGPEFDELWSRLKGGYDAIFTRDSKFLGWRFENVPDLNYRKFIAYRGEVAVGYIILRRAECTEPRIGTIVDLFAERGDLSVMEMLINFGVSHFGDSVAGIDCVTSIPEMERTLRRAGFLVTRTVYPTCVCQDKDLSRELGDLEWFFSKADHDWDQIHLSWDYANNGVSK
jgi:hypothetical protein